MPCLQAEDREPDGAEGRAVRPSLCWCMEPEEMSLCPPTPPATTPRDTGTNQSRHSDYLAALMTFLLVQTFETSAWFSPFRVSSCTSYPMTTGFLKT